MKTIIKTTTLILVVLSLVLMATWSDYEPPEKIKVVMDNNYPPFVFYDENNQLQGILIDEWQLFEEKTGIQVEITALDWNDALIGMENGDYDVIDTIFRNPEREKIYQFTEPYADIDVSIFFRSDLPGINTLNSIKPFTVAAKRGDNAVEVLLDAGVDNIVYYESYEAIVQAASKDEVIIFVIDNPPARYFLYKYKLQDDFRYTEPLYTGYFHRAVRHEDASLIEILEDGFALITEEEHGVINEKWYGKTERMSTEVTKYILTLALIALVVVLGLLLWNTVLRRAVHKKTNELSDTIDQMAYNKSKLDAVIESLPDWVFIVRRDGLYLDFMSNKGLDKLMTSPENFIGKFMSDFFDEALTQRFMTTLDRVFKEGDILSVEYALNKDILRHYEARFSKINDEEAVVTVRDTTEKMVIHQKLLDLSIYDMPTGLYNRNYFEDQLEIMRKDMSQGLGFLILDFDGLKLVNDTLGHNVGDTYLKTLADLLKEVFEDAEFVARIGGDEFVVVLKETSETQLIDAKSLLQSRIKGLNEANALIPFSISAGFSVYGVNAWTVEDMIKEADDFMYREKLFHRQSMKSKNIETLITMLDERDFLTQGHGNRMKDYVVKMGTLLGFDGAERDALVLFAQFHDIGKIGISDKILYKEGRLDDKEYAEMKRHTEIGFRIAESSPDLTHISEWIYKHHEWWNGGGYPFGLKDQEIPLACRILTIVDAYDAMTNDRPYRKALSREDALTEIKSCAGHQFDPNLVPVFINMIQKSYN